MLPYIIAGVVLLLLIIIVYIFIIVSPVVGMVIIQ